MNDEIKFEDLPVYPGDDVPEHTGIYRTESGNVVHYLKCWDRYPWEYKEYSRSGKLVRSRKWRMTGWVEDDVDFLRAESTARTLENNPVPVASDVTWICPHIPGETDQYAVEGRQSIPNFIQVWKRSKIDGDTWSPWFVVDFPSLPEEIKRVLR